MPYTCGVHQSLCSLVNRFISTPTKVNNKNKSKNSKSKNSNKARTQSRNKARRVKASQQTARSFGVDLAPSSLQRPKMSSTAVSLSKCALKYALALADPFHPSARGACIPIGAAATHKAQAILRFDIPFGTNGVAAILISPSLANDLPSVFYTTSAFTGTSATPLLPFSSGGTTGAGGTASTLATGWTTASFPVPYTALQLLGPSHSLTSSNAVAGRIVSLGVRSQYTGTLMNESGVYYCYHDTSHSSLSGVTSNQIGAFADADVTGVTRKPCQLVVHSVSEAEMNFSNASQNPNDIVGVTEILYPYSNCDFKWSTVLSGATTFNATVSGSSLGTWVPACGTPIGVITATGVAGQTLHMELTINAEYTGLGASSSLTDSQCDPVAADRIKTAALKLPRMKLDAPESATPWGLMKTALSNVWNDNKAYIVPATINAVAAML